MTRSAWLALVTAAACGGSGGAGPGPAPGPGDTPIAEDAHAEAPPAWLDGTPPPELPEAEHFVVVARGPTTEAALAQAQRDLAERVLHPGPGESAPALEPLLPAGAIAQREHALADGGIAVLLSLRRDVYRDAALGWLASAPTDAPPAAGVAFLDELRDATARLGALRARRLVCASLALADATPCQLGDEAGAAAALEALAAQLRLTSPQAQGGVVLRRGELPVRPLTLAVGVERAGRLEPLAGVPLRLAAAEPCLPETARTGDDGSVRLAFTTPPASAREVHVTLDRTAGEPWEALPELTLVVPLRELTRESARLAVHINEVISERPTNSAQTAGALVAVVGARVASAALLAPSLLEIIESPRTLEQAVRDVADAGPIDVLVLGEASASFANRMGARSVWFEATGKAVLYDAWTGAPLGEVSRTTQAVGLGDGAAAHKALAELGKLLGEDAAKLLEARLGPSP